MIRIIKSLTYFQTLSNLEISSTNKVLLIPLYETEQQTHEDSHAYVVIIKKSTEAEAFIIVSNPFLLKSK